MAEIIVKGRAEARLAPTEAIVSVTVQTRAADSQSEAVSRCAHRCGEVDEVIDPRRGGLVRRATTSSVRTGPEWDHTPRQGRRLRGYVATRTTELACEPDGDALTDLIGAIAGMVDVHISGPRWQVAADAEGWDLVRASAAVDARRRAAAYAGGLGLSVGRPLWVAEPGLRDAASAPTGGGATFQTMAARPGPEGADAHDDPLLVRIVAEPIMVSVELEAAFELS